MLEQILEEYSIEVVINRTKISRRNLEKLKNGDFEGMTRPQAYGFLRILEREFDEDFSDLKAQLDQWFEQTPPPSNEPIFQPERGARREGGSRKLWVGLLVVAVAALGIYLYMTEFARSGGSTGFATNPAAVTREAAPSPAEAAAPSRETAETAQPAAAEAAKPEAAPQAAAEGNETEAAATEAKPQEKKAEEPEPYVPLEPVAVTPVVKLWFGIIDLKTKKRTAKVTDRPYEIDSHGKKLLVTGHGRFELSDAFGNLFKYNDAKKHYFLIDDGLVKEITKEEFRRLNGGKVW